jgi:hypothetical protein
MTVGRAFAATPEAVIWSVPKTQGEKIVNRTRFVVAFISAILGAIAVPALAAGAAVRFNQIKLDR